MRLQDLLAEGSRRLAEAGVPGPARDARLILAAALKVPPDRVSLMADEPAADAAMARFREMIAQREARRPVSQILGRRRFWGRDFRVTRDVLDPRPETECLVALALAAPTPARLLDLGTGSGALLVTLLAEWPEATGCGTDVSDAALAVAAQNAAHHGVAARAQLVRADWLEGVAGTYDLIVCNPPYIPLADLGNLDPEVRDWEPRLALTPGPDGLESYRCIAAGIAPYLASGGRALLEFGDGQGVAVAEIFRRAGLAECTLHPDLDGRKRILSVRRRA